MRDKALRHQRSGILAEKAGLRAWRRRCCALFSRPIPGGGCGSSIYGELHSNRREITGVGVCHF